MKKTTIITLFILLISPVALLAADDEIEESRALSDFKWIQVSGGVDVYLTQGTSLKMRVVGESGSVGNVITEVEDGKLTVTRKKGTNWFDFKPVKVYVTFVELEKISCFGGSDVYGQGNIQSEKMFIDCSGGSDVKVDLDAKKVGLETSGGSDIKIEGKANYVIAVASGGSDIFGYEFQANSAQLKASGGSDIRITVIDELEAIASGGSDISYSGNPDKVKSDISSSSDLRKR